MLTVCSTTHEDVITVNGKLNGKNAKCLIDSGASGNFINRAFISDADSRLFQISKVGSKNVKLADGSIISTDEIISGVDTHIHDKTVKCTFVVLPKLNNNYDCILGMPYLKTADPIISFKDNTIEWRLNQRDQITSEELDSNPITPLLPFNNVHQELIKRRAK